MKEMGLDPMKYFGVWMEGKSFSGFSLQLSKIYGYLFKFLAFNLGT